MKEPRVRVWHLWVAIIILAVALVYIITLNLWGLRPWGKTIDYTRFGTWSNAISGIGTTAAVIVALTAHYWQRISQTTAETSKLQEEEVAVFQWLTFKEIRDPQDNPIGRVWDLKIQNSTLLPIYRWKVILNTETEDLCNHIKRPLLPGENFFNVPDLDEIAPHLAPEPILVFEGTSGRVWKREPRGAIYEIDKQTLICSHGSPTNNAVDD